MSDFGFRTLDDVIHSRIRLAVLAALATVEAGDFSWLKQVTGATDGNLAIHLRKLEDVDYVSVEKTFENRRPKTRYALTAVGRNAFQAYVDRLESMLEGFRGKASKTNRNKEK